MINVVIKKYNNEICGFIIDGHANYSIPGTDIVCSAVSVLVLNTINSIKCFTSEPIDCSISNDGGYVNCSFPNFLDGVKNHDVSLLLNSMLLGILAINEKYFKHIKINYLEVSDCGS